jgi:hypothetical protein
VLVEIAIIWFDAFGSTPMPPALQAISRRQNRSGGGSGQVIHTPSPGRQGRVRAFFRLLTAKIANLTAIHCK